MPFFLLAILLGMLTYWVIQKSVASITRTPVWLLWLVMMIPVFVLTAWLVLQGTEQPPMPLVYGLFILCPIVYAFLIMLGRLPDAQTRPAAPSPPTTPKPTPQRPITRDEETSLQQCFPWSVYYLQDIEYRAQAMICRGQLKSSPAVAYQTVEQNVKALFGDRFLLLFQEGMQGKPFFALIPNPQGKVPQELHSAAWQPTAAQPTTGWQPNARQRAAREKTELVLNQPGLAVALVLSTLLTTTLAGVFYINETSLEALQETPTLLWPGFVYGLLLMLILGTHELGHYWMARRYLLKATLPYFIPIPFFLGTFGAFIQLRSPMPHRRALFDVGIAGPLAGLLVTLPVLVWGLAHSTPIELTDASSLLNFKSLDPHGSVLLTLLSKLALGQTLQSNQAIALHPAAVAGCLGLVVTALNLMPVGQLDGGHIVHAMYGQRNGAFIGQISRFLVLLLALIHEEFFLWAILLFFIPTVDEPALNDVSELDQRRDLLGLAALALLLIIVLPTPPALTQLLF